MTQEKSELIQTSEFMLDIEGAILIMVKNTILAKN